MKTEVKTTDKLTSCKVYSLFNASGKIEECKDEILKIGQIIWLNGYGQSQHGHERLAIYEINNNGFNGRVQYKWVNLDKPKKGIEDAYTIRPESKIFGIGIYYTPGDFATPEQITEALSLANEAEKKAKEDKEKADKERAELIEKGREIFEANKPADAVAVIVADLEKDESDLMTDYFNSVTTKTVILAFSNHTRDLFGEMRKAALNCDIPEIKELATAPAEYEHREKYSMGAGYYLGRSRYSGWQIRKGSLKYRVENLYYEAGRGGFYAFKKEDQAPAPAEPISGDGLILVDYSEKALALFGNTRPIKDTLKELGGRFNPALQLKGVKTAGWVFSKSKRELLNSIVM